MSSTECPPTERQVDVLVERNTTLRGPRSWGCRLGDVMGSLNLQLVGVVKDLMQEREGGGRCQRTLENREVGRKTHSFSRSRVVLHFCDLTNEPGQRLDDADD